MKLFGSKGSKSGGKAQKARSKTPGGPKNKKLKPWQIALLALGGLVGVGLVAVAIFMASAKPPDVAPKPQDKNTGTTVGTEDEFADLVAPFIDDGDKERKKDYYTFMLCGTDDGGTRTDTIIVVSYNITTQEINMVNIPRDTMSNVKRKIKKINSGFNGGPEQLEKELEMLLGIPIDRYVVVDFKGFEQLIDLIGGVDFNVPTYMVWDDPTQDLHIFLEPGMQHLDGAKAVQLVRFRQNNPGVKGGYAEGDIGRIKMQQEFLRTVAKKLLSPKNLLKVGDIASAVLKNTETNLSLNELTWFGLKALKMNFNNINMTTLPGHAAYLYEADYGHMQSYFVPEEQPILDMVNELLNPYVQSVTKLNLIDVSKYATKAPAGSSGSSDGKADDPPASSGSSGSSGNSGNSGNNSAGNTGNNGNGSSGNTGDSGNTGGTETPPAETPPTEPTPEQPPENGNTGGETTTPPAEPPAGGTEPSMPTPAP